jgi:uncharacterized protein (TIGR00369 family)
MKTFHLTDDGHCFACGRQNVSGLKLDFRTEDGKTFAEFVPQKVHQGFKDIVHGGIITTVLDEAMVKVVLSTGIEALTVEIAVRFKSTLSVGETSVVEAEIMRMGSRLIETTARMRKNDNTVVAEARAKLFRNA